MQCTKLHNKYSCENEYLQTEVARLSVMLTSIVTVCRCVVFDASNVINLLQSLLATSDKEKVGIMEQWTVVEQQKQNAENKVSELQVC